MKSSSVPPQFPLKPAPAFPAGIFAPRRLLLATGLLVIGALSLRGQSYDGRASQEASVAPADPSELYLRAYTSVQQADKLEQDGQLRPALAKYRFAASLLDQLSQTNPNWQPLIVRYRQRKTIESIQKLEEKGVVLQNPAAGVGQSPTAPGNSYGQPATLPAAPAPDDELPVPDNGYGQPAPRAAGPVNVTPEGPQQPPPTAPALESVNRTTQELRGKLDKAQKDLKGALDSLAAARKEKQDVIKEKENIAFQLQSSHTEVKLAQKRFERTKADRDGIQVDLDKAETRSAFVRSKRFCASFTSVWEDCS